MRSALATAGAVLLLLVANGASAAPVILKAPFSGTAYTQKAHFHAGCGGNFVLFGGPKFNPTTGRGTEGQESNSTPCGGAPTVEYSEEKVTIGLNSSTFTVATTVAHATVRMHWYVDYFLDIFTRWGNSSQSAYASTDVNVSGTVTDTTTHVTYYPTNSFDNFTFFSDANVSWFYFVFNTFPTLFFNLSLKAGDVYEYSTGVTVTTVSDIVGTSSYGAAYVYMDPNWYHGGGEWAKLESVSY
jgi:hypothetical protein